MKILYGKLPEGKKWRTLVLLPPGGEPSWVWQFALQLAKASNGEAVAALILTGGSSRIVQQAEATLQKARAQTSFNAIAHFVIVEARKFNKALATIVQLADIDLLLIDGENLQWQGFGRLPCATAVIRGSIHHETYHSTVETDKEVGATDGQLIRRILVPTRGGPNSVVALSLLLPLAPSVKLTAAYGVPNYLGSNEAAHARVRLRQLSKFVDAIDRVERKVIHADSVTQGIVDEARDDYDLVVIGASRESSFDRAVFGDVVGAVVRQSNTPVAVVWEPSSMITNLGRHIAWRLQNVIPRLNLRDRTSVYVRIRRSARPNIDFFVLIGLSTLIAALGLLLSSPAVVIGAMLVAPLMSPIIGTGLAIVLGNPRFLRLSVGAVSKGMLLAIALGFLAGWLQNNVELTPEIISRTQPTLLDLGVALFAGFAGAYALSNSDAAAALPGVAISAALVPPLAAVGIALSAAEIRAALGALLLFSTNLVAIIAAAVVIFVALGFRPSQERKAQRAMQQRSVRVAMILLVIITTVLGITTYRLAAEARFISRVNRVTEQYVEEMEGVELDQIEIENLNNPEEPLTLHLTVRATHLILHAQAEALREKIAGALQPYIDDREMAMTLTVTRVTILDPQVPPTPQPVDESTAIETPALTSP